MKIFNYINYIFFIFCRISDLELVWVYKILEYTAKRSELESLSHEGDTIPPFRNSPICSKYLPNICRAVILILVLRGKTKKSEEY